MKQADYARASAGAAVLAAVLFAAAMPLAVNAEGGRADAGKNSLRSLGAANGIFIGTAAEVFGCFDDPPPFCQPFEEKKFVKKLKREFSLLMPGNDMQWNVLRPTRNSYDFDRADFIVNFAAENDMVVQGHMLLWHSQLPGWLTENQYGKKELQEIMADHIETVASHYRGQVESWNVINEAVGDPPYKSGSQKATLRKGIWMDGIGPKYIELAFKEARRADPDARLFYNDYGHEGWPEDHWNRPKQEAVYRQVEKLAKKGLVDGVGFQMHLYVGDCCKGWNPDPDQVAANFSRYSDLGLEVRITEMDVRIEEPVTKAKLDEQAKLYREMVGVCLAAANCTTFSTWGFTDKHSWINYTYPGFGAPLLFDERYKKKKSYRSVAKALKQGK